MTKRPRNLKWQGCHVKYLRFLHNDHNITLPLPLLCFLLKLNSFNSLVSLYSFTQWCYKQINMNYRENVCRVVHHNNPFPQPLFSKQLSNLVAPVRLQGINLLSKLSQPQIILSRTPKADFFLFPFYTSWDMIRCFSWRTSASSCRRPFSCER